MRSAPKTVPQVISKPVDREVKIATVIAATIRGRIAGGCVSLSRQQGCSGVTPGQFACPRVVVIITVVVVTAASTRIAYADVPEIPVTVVCADIWSYRDHH